MRKTLPAILILCSFSFVISKSSFVSKTVRLGKNKLEFIEVQKGLYAQSTEVRNAEYQYFLNDLRALGRTDLYHKYYPDTSNWRTDSTIYDDINANTYFWHPYSMDYPVVNVKLGAANAFCEWLGGQYKWQTKDKTMEARFFIPSREQWMVACHPFKDNMLPWEGPDSVTEQKANVNPKKYAPYDPGEGLYAPVISYGENPNGMFNIIGNAAEMTNVDGVACGGSITNTIDECRADKTTSYHISDPRVGFRVFMTLEKVKQLRYSLHN